MRNVSLDQFNKRIKNKIAVVGGYLEDRSICAIIKSCRLKPLSAYSDNFDLATKLETVWVDEFNNVMEIRKKKLKIHFNYTKIPITTTDLFRYETVKFIAQHSHYACIGIYPSKKNCIVLFVGSDNYFRCYNVGEDIKLVSPLCVGMKLLGYCARLRGMRNLRKLTIKSELKMLNGVEWIIVRLPANKVAIEYLDGCEKLKEILTNGE